MIEVFEWNTQRILAELDSWQLAYKLRDRLQAIATEHKFDLSRRRYAVRLKGDYLQ